MTYPDLEGKAAIVTGGGGGIGTAAAARLLREGASVALVDLRADQLAAAAERLAAPEGRLVTIPADVTREGDVAGYVAQTLDAFGTIDLFFNNAGVVGTMKPIVDLTESEFRLAIDVNLVGAFLGLKHVLPVLYAKGGGAVVNTSSIAGHEATRETASYDSSKHGVAGLTKVAALESVGRGVRVNSIHPGPVDTNLMADIQRMRNPQDPTGDRDRIAAVIPMGRPASAEEVANLAVFLLSEEASFITGVGYRIDGGMGAAARLVR